MADRHKKPNISYRPPEGLRGRLIAYKERTGQAVNAILTRAVTEYLDRHDPETNPESQKES